MQSYPSIPFRRSQVNSSPRLLREFRGEILIICNKGKIEICVQPHDPYLQMVVVRFSVFTRSSNVRFLVGVVTPKGGCFQVISRKEAIIRMDRWVMGHSPTNQVE